MASNLVQLIFNQFLEIVERLAKHACFVFDECEFDYRVREMIGHKLLDVIYIVEDKCGRRRDVLVVIDITNICYEDLVTCKWVEYLEKLAKEFVDDICPKKYVIVKDEVKKCRPQPPRWTPFPCSNVTTVIHRRKHVPVEPECEVVVERECECVPLCKREHCVPSEKIVIKYDKVTPWKCGDYSVLVEEPQVNKHDFNVYKGHQDYNNHLWKPCCGQKNYVNDTYYANTTHH